MQNQIIIKQNVICDGIKTTTNQHRSFLKETQ